MITQFHVANYKALRDVTLDLTPIHVLIGPNNSGKSSLLEAIALLGRSVEQNANGWWPNGTNLRGLLWDASGDNKFSLGCQLTDGKLKGSYGFSCGFSPTNPKFVAITEVAWKPEGGELIAFPKVSAPWAAVHFHIQHPDSDSVHSALTEQLYDALKGMQILRWNPRMLKTPVILSSEHNFSLHNTGFGLAQCLDDILGHDRITFGAIESMLAEIFPEIAGIELRSEQGYAWPGQGRSEDTPLPGNQAGKSIYFKLRDGKSIPAAQASDGVMIVLGYLALLHVPKPPRMVLLEEPENGIHPQRLKEVMGFLRQLVLDRPGTQILMTTHSPYLLDAFEPAEVTHCAKAPDGSISTHRLSEVPEVMSQRKVFSLGEIWTAEGDDLLAKPATNGAA